MLIVLGAAERKRIEPILPELHPQIQKVYAEAKTYHDGRWLAIVLDGDKIIPDILRLLEIKRKPCVIPNKPM